MASWLVHSTITRAIDADPPRDDELTELLTRVYVDAGFTDPAVAATIFEASAVRARGELLYVRPAPGEPLAGTVIFVPSTAPGRRFAERGEAELHLLNVRADQRRTGIGRALVQAVIERARANGCHRLLLWTQPPMHAAQRLYESLGFERRPDRDFEKSGRRFLFYRREL